MSVFQTLLEGKSEQPAMGGKLLTWVGAGCERKVVAVVQARVRVRMRMRVKVSRRWVGEAKMSCGCMVCSLEVSCLLFVFSVPASDSALPDLSLVPPWYAFGIPVPDPFRSSISQGKETNNSFVKKTVCFLLSLALLSDTVAGNWSRHEPRKETHDDPCLTV